MRLSIFGGVLVLSSSCADHAPRPTTPVTSTITTTRANPPAVSQTSTKRTVISLSRVSGSNITTTSTDGTLHVLLDVLSNGRGPHVEAVIRRNDDGTLGSFVAHGHHTMGTTIAETFSETGGRATWKSNEEQGDREIHGGAFYIPMAPLPDETGMLVQALIKAGGTLPLLPAGEAHLEKVTQTTVRSSGGDEKVIVGYTITGLDFTPTYVWMNQDGTWFANISHWFSVVPEGYETSVDSLIEKQTELDRKRDAALATALVHQPPAAGLAYTHARVLDVEKGKWIPDQTVLVVGDTIKKVGSKIAIPAGAETIDLNGKALIPGLWDMHAHTGDADGVLNIASGVTTVRDVGNDPDKLDDYKKRYDEGTAIGPHVFRFGFIEGRGEKAASSKITAETETEAKDAVAFFKKRGYDGIKIYNSVKPELVPVITKEAHASGMTVTGHIPVHMLANEAVRAGYDGIEHINMLFLNFFADHDTDTRTTKRFSLVGEKAATFDLKSKPVVDFFALLKQHHTIIDPTANAFEDLLVGEQGKILPGLETTASRLPVQVERSLLVGGLPLEGNLHETYKASYDKMLAMIKALHEAKIDIVVGTDSIAGLMLDHELALFVRAGISTADALKMATIDAARSQQQDQKSGTISAGKMADLVVIDGDPLARIDDVGKVVSTMRAGKVFPSAALFTSVGVRP